MPDEEVRAVELRDLNGDVIYTISETFRDHGWWPCDERQPDPFTADDQDREGLE